MYFESYWIFLNPTASISSPWHSKSPHHLLDFTCTQYFSSKGLHLRVILMDVFMSTSQDQLTYSLVVLKVDFWIQLVHVHLWASCVIIKKTNKQTCLHIYASMGISLKVIGRIMSNPTSHTNHHSILLCPFCQPPKLLTMIHRPVGLWCTLCALY